mmetsp:Transcript_48674/g.136086  ORF Transcript_48674/g.136086 Transcript_48674/m.136086 type:complete len:285 (+) Transcript_48674:866-1720(+)
MRQLNHISGPICQHLALLVHVPRVEPSLLPCLPHFLHRTGGVASIPGDTADGDIAHPNSVHQLIEIIGAVLDVTDILATPPPDHHGKAGAASIWLPILRVGNLRAQDHLPVDCCDELISKRTYGFCIVLRHSGCRGEEILGKESPSTSKASFHGGIAKVGARLRSCCGIVNICACRPMHEPRQPTIRMTRHLNTWCLACKGLHRQLDTAGGDTDALQPCSCSHALGHQPETSHADAGYTIGATPRGAIVLDSNSVKVKPALLMPRLLPKSPASALRHPECSPLG